MKCKSLLTGLFATFVGLTTVSAQDIVARVPGLESNKDYMTLLRNDDKLRHQTDSLLAIIRDVRVAMRADSDVRDSLSQVRMDSMRIVLADAENLKFFGRNSTAKSDQRQQE